MVDVGDDGEISGQLGGHGEEGRVGAGRAGGMEWVKPGEKSSRR